MDIVVTSLNEKPRILRNSGDNGGHWLLVKLAGTRSNRDAVGARVTVSAGGRSAMEEVHGSGSYLSYSDVRLHFGVGPETRVDALQVDWPSGRRDRIGPLDADQFVTIEEGSGVAAKRKH